MTTVTIPLTTLAVGAHSFGPATVQTTDTSATLNIDRTVANGLNANPTTSFDVSLQYSLDGGVTWLNLAGTTGTSGGVDSKHPNSWSLQAGLPGVAFQLRGTITVHTVAFAVAGTVVTA